MIFYDYEVFKEDWLVVFNDTKTKDQTIIINDPEALQDFHGENENDIWIGYNNNRYDQYIHKAILCGFDPKEVNDFIIAENNPGYRFSGLFRKIKMFNYDVMTSSRASGGLKMLEGYMGSDIRESSVPFDVDRKLTDEEIQDTIKYCQHDVQETMKLFLETKDDFETHLSLTELANDGKGANLSLLSRTGTQLSAIILEATKKPHNDEWDLFLPETLKIEKYTHVVDWYKSDDSRKYYKKEPYKLKKGYRTVQNQLTVDVAGVPHVFGWGGLHGAREQYSTKGDLLLVDVASMYPSIMIEYDLISRNVKRPQKFKEIYDERLRLKAERNPKQAPLKLILNSTYGATKDKNNAMYDPRQANLICMYGQLFLLDLIEKLEDVADIIQSNTDGILIKLRNSDDYDLIDDICYEWEQRTRMELEFEEYQAVYQKDVNNYVLVDYDGNVVSKGAYVKKLDKLDNNLPIVNEALVQYMVNDVPIETTINSETKLLPFQLVCKLSRKYSHFLLNGEKINERTVRTFASTRSSDGGLQKVHAVSGRPQKFPNSPKQNFLFNDDMEDVLTPDYLDRQFYIDMAKNRLKGFGLT